MNRLRTKWGKRWLVVIMLSGLIPISVLSVVHSIQPSSAYADWVRQQLREPADASIERALATATARRARTIEAFLVAFVEAFEAQQVTTSLGHIFAEQDLSTEALLVFLQDRYRWRIGDAVVPEVILRSLQAKATQAPSRWIFSPAARMHRDLTAPLGGHTLSYQERPPVVVALRTRFAAQPLGP